LVKDEKAIRVHLPYPKDQHVFVSERYFTANNALQVNYLN